MTDTFMTDQLDPNRADWSWLAGTYWYVPPGSLPALQLDPDENTLTWVADQTVWHITGYRNGYFWGASATMLHDAGETVPRRGPGSRPVRFSMLGTITPEGRVHLTFVRADSSSAQSATIGIGCAVRRGEGFSLEMQMSSGTSTRTAHWAYMMPVRPGDPSWESLPGVGLSVPEMLEGSEPPEVGGESA
jgi:hypothetical protein